MSSYKVKAIVTAGIFILLLACHKNNDKTEGNNNNNELFSQVNTVLQKADSISLFATAFSKLELTSGDLSNGLTLLSPVNVAFGDWNGTGAFPDGATPKDYLVKGVLQFNQLKNGDQLQTLSGKTLTVTVNGGNVWINGLLITGNNLSTSSNFSIFTISGLNINNSGGSYIDPHADEYFIEYTQNGQYKKITGKLHPWIFYSNYQPLPSSYACINSNLNYDGPSAAYALTSNIKVLFQMRIPRENGTNPPKKSEYNNNHQLYDPIFNRSSGNCDLTIEDALYDCSSDGYVHIKVTDSKIEKGTGTDARGYYKGDFDAILYYTPYPGATPQKRTITNGHFMVPLGGSDISITGTSFPSSIDTLTVLTTDKWYFKPFVEKLIGTPNSDMAACNLDDYIVFRKNGTCDWKDGNTICASGKGGIEHGDNIPWSISGSTIKMGSETATITLFTESSLILNNSLELAHGN